MSRRRAQREADREDFLDANPELRTYEARIEVGRDEGEGGGIPGLNPQVQVQVITPLTLSPYVAQVTQDGEEAFSHTFVIPSGEPDLSLANSVITNVGSLGASGLVLQQNQLSMAQDVLSLSEDGFGVAQFNMYERDLETTGNNYALDGDELLSFQANNSHPGNFLEISDEDPLDLGTTEFGIDYVVLGGRGTVEITLIDYGTGETTATSGSLRSGEQGNLEASMTEGTYEYAEVSVTGSLEIAIVGIDVTSNTELMAAPA